MNKIITVDFKNRSNIVSVCGLNRWDYGKILQVSGLNLDEVTEIHFSQHEESGTALVVEATREDGVLTAPIPNILLTDENRKNRIYVFIYLKDKDSGQTVRKIVLHVRPRPKPEDYVYTETEVFSYNALSDRVKVLEENSGSGGVTSWNDLEDRPFGDETVATDISGQSYTINCDYGASYVSWTELEHDGNLPLELGQVWSVKTELMSSFSNIQVQDDNGTLYIGTLIDATNYPFCIKKNTLKLNKSFISQYGYPEQFILTCESGSIHTTTVKQIDEKYIPEQIQSDWNENDESSKAYVKNRTHWTTGSIAEILPLADYDFSEYLGVGLYETSITTNSSENLLISEKKYNITWDGVEYTSVAQTDTDSGVIFLGNPSYGSTHIVNKGGTSDLPFFICSKNVSDVYHVYFIGLGSGTHSIALYENNEEVKQLDDKYIPSTVARLNDLIGGSGTGKNSEIFNSNYNTASGDYSHAEGNRTTASGYCSHAESYGNTASGGYSHAEGCNTMASGNYSHTEGQGTKTSSNHQHVQGKYNVEDTADTYAHIVGNGTSLNARSNAHTLDWNGNAEFAGDVIANGCGGENPVSLVEVAAKANESDVFIVNVAGNSTDGYTSDKTFAEITEAYNAGKSISLFCDSTIFPLKNIIEQFISFSNDFVYDTYVMYQGFIITNTDEIHTSNQSFNPESSAYSSLATTDKTILGAINELLTRIKDLEDTTTTLEVIENGTY